MRLVATWLVAGLAAFCAPAAHAGQFHLWSLGVGDTLLDNVAGVAVDSDGGVVIAGQFIGELDLGGTPLVSEGLVPDVFIARFHSDGTLHWSRRFGDSMVQLCRAVAMGPDGEIVITGYFGGTIDFGGGPLTAADPIDAYVACFDRTGAHRWSKGFARAQTQIGNDVAVASDGSVFLAGSFVGRIDLGGGQLSSFGSFDAFLVRYDAQGDHLWSQRFGDAAVQEGACVAVDAAGNVALAGTFAGSIDLGGGALASAGGDDIYIGRWDQSANPLWSHRYGDAGQQATFDIACAPDGETMMSGVFFGTVDFGGGDLVAVADSRAFLAFLDADGAHRWSAALPGSTYEVLLRAVALTGTRALACGLLREYVDIQGDRLISAGAEDLLVLDFDHDGNLVDSMVRGRAGSETAYGVAATADGGLVLVGEYSGQTSVGGDELPLGVRDILVASYSPVDPAYTPILAFSALLREGTVEARWQFASTDPAATYALERRSVMDSLWVTLTTGTAAQHAGGYDDRSVAPGNAYDYRLRVDTGTRRYASRVTTVAVPTVSIALGQNAPNPFPAVTTIAYETDATGPVVIQVYDAAGRRVARLDQGVRSAGGHETLWDGRDAAGRPCASGVYFYRLEGIPAAGTRKMLLLR